MSSERKGSQQGMFRRRIRLLQASNHIVIAGVEDDFHAFKLVLNHNGHKVVAVTGEAIRYPLDTCLGAVAIVEQLAGASLSSDCREIGAFADAHQHCTHLFDLAGLAIAHACRDAKVRQYDICIPDPVDDQSELVLKRDGVEILRMTLSGDTIKSPAAYEGQSIQRDFASWVQSHIPDQEQREAALVLKRGHFISVARLQKELFLKTKTPLRHVPVGVCYSYQVERIDLARRMEDSLRDFSDETNSLLAFML